MRNEAQMPKRAELIPWAKPTFWGNEEKYVNQALFSTWISGGPFVDQLEQRVAEFCGVPHALAVSNGTTAVHLAYLALGLGAGDEVIVPGFCFQAAANIALHLQARPVFAEVDPQTWCLAAADVEKRLNSRTRAIVAVHTYGNMCDLDSLRELAEHHGVPLIEDAAESFASRYKGRLAGTVGVLGTFSFHATKTITTGEGGMVLTRDESSAKLMKMYRSHGMVERRYWHEVPGHNFRLTNFQAAIGCAQFEHLQSIISERKRVHEQYRSFLSDQPGIKMQCFTPEVEPVLWAMTVKLDPRAYPQGRDAVMEEMKHARIETRPGFYAPSQMKIYDCDSLPVSEDISRNTISLPTHVELTNADIEEICAHLKGLRH